MLLFPLCLFVYVKNPLIFFSVLNIRELPLHLECNTHPVTKDNDMDHELSLQKNTWSKSFECRRKWHSVNARKYGFAVAALSKILEYSKSHLLHDECD
jgi:hypothetical protein